MNKRFDHIDLLRAFSIVGVMVIHTLSFSLRTPSVIFIWNSLQFVVAAFIFCSGFVHAHYLTTLTSFSSIVGWYKKRIIRILIPFYLYFAIHFLLFLLFPTQFSHFGLQKNIYYIFGSIFLYGGMNTNWLPVLFIELTLLTPILFFLHRKKFLVLYSILAFLVTCAGTLWFFPYGLYKILMLVPWSLVFLLGLFSETTTKQKKLWSIVAIGSALFFILLILWPSLHHSLNFTDNKYPPNLYYLSYATVVTLLAYTVSKRVVQYIPVVMYQYISTKSYSLFFIHFLVLDIVISFLPQHPTPFLLIKISIVVAASLGIQKMLDSANHLVKQLGDNI